MFGGCCSTPVGEDASSFNNDPPSTPPPSPNGYKEECSTVDSVWDSFPASPEKDLAKASVSELRNMIQEATYVHVGELNARLDRIEALLQNVASQSGPRRTIMGAETAKDAPGIVLPPAEGLPSDGISTNHNRVQGQTTPICEALSSVKSVEQNHLPSTTAVSIAPVPLSEPNPSDKQNTNSSKDNGARLSAVSQGRLSVSANRTKQMRATSASEKGMFVGTSKEFKRRVSAISRNRQTYVDLTINKKSKAKVFDVEERSFSKRECVARVVHSSRFETFITVMIILNSGLIGLQMDWTAENGREVSQPTYMIALEIMFTILFSVELGMRLVSEGKQLFISKQHRKWAIMDTIIVVSAWIEQIFLSLPEESTPEGNYNVFAALRILRLVRVARSVRLMQFSRDLRALVMGVVNCMKPLIWALILLGLITFIFTVIILEFSIDHFDLSIYNRTAMETTTPEPISYHGCEKLLGEGAKRMLMMSDDLDKDVAASIGRKEELQLHFGNLPRGMFTLYKAVSGGQNWGEVSEPLKHISWFLLIFFCFYIGVVVFAVLNIVTSIFIENARKNADRDKENLIWEEVQEYNWRCWCLRAMFNKADTDISGTLTWEKFNDHFQDPIVKAFVRTLGLSTEKIEMKTLFDLFDVDGTGLIDSESFVAGFSHLRGPASSIDLTLLRQDTQEIAGMMEEILQFLQETKADC